MTHYGQIIVLIYWFYLGFFVWGGVEPEKIFEPRGGEKKIFCRPSRGVWGHAPQKILKI